MNDAFMTYERALWLKENGFPQKNCKWLITQNGHLIKESFLKGKKFAKKFPVRPSFEEYIRGRRILEIAKGFKTYPSAQFECITNANATMENWESVFDLWELICET